VQFLLPALIGIAHNGGLSGEELHLPIPYKKRSLAGRTLSDLNIIE
jgi:hypothetical protein